MKNKEFNLFGSVWKLNYKDKVFDGEDWLYGAANGMNRECEVSLKTKDNKTLPKEEIEIAKLHELVHAIFMAGQYNNCNQDEPLVEWVARCLYSLKQQKII